MTKAFSKEKLPDCLIESNLSLTGKLKPKKIGRHSNFNVYIERSEVIKNNNK